MKSSTRAYATAVLAILGHAFASPILPGNEVSSKETSPLSKRLDIPACNIDEGTVLVGDGAPTQNYLHKQLSASISCGSALQCTAGASDSQSYSIGFSATAELTDWLSGGFDVSKTWETGNSYECTGVSGDNVCIWQNIAHTAYTVRNYVGNSCDSDLTYSDPLVITSPNTNNVGGGYYCVIGTCRNQGDEYWE